jgi:drug/metabolite transporter (DMT)-like permease
VALERGGVRRNRLGRANAARLAGTVLFGGMLAPVLLLAALRLTLAGSISLLLNLEGVATALLGVALFREHLGPVGWLGVAGALGAGGVLASGGGWPGIAGALLTGAACVCWALDNHLSALIDGMTPARITFVKGGVAGAVNLALGVVTAPLVAGPGTIAAALAVGALSYGASIALFIRSAREVGATRAQAVFASAPYFGAALSFLFLHEPLGIAHLAASPLLVASLGALFLSRHSHPHAHEAIEHAHSHRHDDGHHFHEHPGLPPGTRHSHLHRHEPLVHAHPHWPDLHHRHRHSS